MDAEYLVIDDHAQGQEVEHVGKVMPHIRVSIFPRTLGIESIRLRDASGLVVASNQMHTVGVSQL